MNTLNLPQGDELKQFITNLESLLYYLKAQVDDVENIDEVSRKYEDLNTVEKYVVDNHEKFMKGVKLNDIKIEGYETISIAKKLQSTCEMKRKQVDGVRNRIYKLKPREQIPDIYAIINRMKQK